MHAFWVTIAFFKDLFILSTDSLFSSFLYFSTANGNKYNSKYSMENFEKDVLFWMKKFSIPIILEKSTFIGLQTVLSKIICMSRLYNLYRGKIFTLIKHKKTRAYHFFDKPRTIIICKRKFNLTNLLIANRENSYSLPAL